MWNRQQVKEQAKQIMKRNYWKMFVVTLLTGILTGGKTTIIERVQDFASNNLSYDAQPIFYSSNFQYIFYSFISVASILGIFYTIFIGNVIVVGKNGYFIKNNNENPELSEIFKGFKGNYLNVVKILFLMDLKTLLWLFLFIVPGVIKAYEYSMIPYLLAENPNLSADEGLLFVQTNDDWTKDGSICLRFIFFRMDYSRCNLLRNWTSICTTISRSNKSRSLFDFKTQNIGGIIYV